jgi:hypothetical protein
MEEIKQDAPAPKKKNGFRRFIKKLTLFLFVGLVLYLGITYLFAAVFVYSSGDRIGYIYKFSHKGYVFKTNEGILKTGFVNIGNSTTLYYKEYYTRLFFKGDTKYFVYKMEKMPTQ